MHRFNITELGSVLYLLPDGSELELSHVILTDEDIEYVESVDVLDQVMSVWVSLNSNKPE